MRRSPQLTVTPDLARQLLTGEKSLSALFGVSQADVVQMATFGHELWRQGRYQEAAKMFQAIVALDDTIYYGHAGLGLVAMKIEDFVAAERYLIRAVELAPEDSSVAVNLGETLLRLGRLQDAVAAMQKAVAIDPSGRDPGASRARAILIGIGHGAAQLAASK